MKTTPTLKEGDNNFYDVIIIGGGAVGCSIAREVSKVKGIKVVLLEKEADVSFGTSKANSGIVHPGHHDKPGSVKGGVVVRGNALIKELAAELGFGYRQCGEVMVARTQAEMDTLLALTKQAEQQKVPVEVWSKEKLLQEEPNLSKDLVGGLYAPTAGVVSPYEMVHALMGVALKNGVELCLNTPVVGINKLSGTGKERLEVVSSTGAKFVGTYVLNCAGVYADKIANMVGLNDFVIKPRKGEEYLLDKDASNIVKRIIFPVPTPVSKGTLIIPTVDGTLMCGPTATDTDDREDFGTTQEGCASIFAFVKGMCPIVNDGAVIASFAGLRAASSTGDFIIGPTSVPGFINVAGIQSPGLTSAPAIAEKVVGILEGEDKATFGAKKGDWVSKVPLPKRFFSMTPQEQEECTKRNPLYGRVVCRCEMVTEGDIHDAIDNGATTLDGVKFRTRAGMGRCQAGFCTSRTAQILSQRLGIPLTQITKRGSQTELLVKAISNTEIFDKNMMPHLPTPIAGLFDGEVVDVAVIGGGPAGLAAGVGARQAGARSVVVFDREDCAGGILNQCIHSGFGLHYFKEELTGPEYAQRFLVKALESNVHILTSSFVIDVEPLPNGNKKVRVLVANQGVKTVVCRAMVLAMGCRERPRAAIKIPGTRPAGVFTAGLAQKFVNVYGYLPGKRIVILGSGDIGLIMARRMSLENCKVLGVFEIMKTCSGLNRNVVQCLQDYQIPLHLGHTVVAVHGKDRVEKVTVAPVDDRFRPLMDKAWDIECDCLLLSVGLIPENEISHKLNIAMHPRTRGPIVSSALMTSMPGVFAAGNVLHVHDLVDNVSKEGVVAGKNAAQWATQKDNVYVKPGSNVMYVLPETISAAKDQVISFRVTKRISPALVKIGNIVTKQFPVAVPSEMIRINVKKEKIQRYLDAHISSSESNGVCAISVDVTLDESELDAHSGKADAEKATKADSSSASAAAADSSSVSLAMAGAVEDLGDGVKRSHHICLSCPHGCELTVVSKNGVPSNISGASCSRGQEYAEQEVRDPRRFFSTTVIIEGAISSKMPVKITKPLPKDKLIEAAVEIQKMPALHAPVKLGQVLLKDLLGFEGCNVVACRTLERYEDENKKLVVDDSKGKGGRAADITLLYDTQDGHAEAAATALADVLEERQYSVSLMGADELEADELPRLHALVVFAVNSTKAGEAVPHSLASFVEALGKTKLPSLHYAAFGIVPAATDDAAAAAALAKALAGAGAVQLCAPGKGADLVSGGYLRAAEEWLDTTLAAALTEQGIVPKKGAAAGEPKQPRRRRYGKKKGAEEEADVTLNIEELPAHYCKSDAVGQYNIAASPDKWLNVVVARTDLWPSRKNSIVEFRVICPTVAQFCEPGQFVMVTLDKKSERIPLTIADFSRSEGWISLVVQNVGYSTDQICTRLVPGKRFSDIAGPLGHKSVVEKMEGGKAVVCVGGGLGVAPVFPILRAHKMAGNRVVGIMGARTKEMVFWEDKMRQYCDELFVTTDDGTYGTKGFVTGPLAEVVAKEKVGRVVAIGPVPMMRSCSSTVPKDIPVIVSLNNIMVDGTGMCGGCRITVGSKTEFVCVDGPEFDGHDIDWDLMAMRLKTYQTQEDYARAACSEAATGPRTAATPDLDTAHIVPRPQARRTPMPAQDAEFRAGNFDEVALGYTEEMARKESLRCKQCENATCRDGCPVGVDIKKFISYVQKGNFRAAVKTIKQNNACPAISGRVCPQETQCEAKCYLKTVEKTDSVAIGNLERFVADWEAAHPDEDEDDYEPGAEEEEDAGEEEGGSEGEENDEDDAKIRGKRVAIVGAGPAGLICAAEVARKGARVTIFEALSAPGGVLIYGIPQFRLPKSIVARETEYIQSLGVEFRYNHPVGPAGSVPQMLESGYSAVFIGTGAGLPWFLGIEGENLKGVYSSNEFLTRVNLMKAYQFPAYPTPVLLTESVAVVGGGNVAMDAARCAKRLGAKNVYIVYRRTRAEMPARLEEVHHAAEEGIIFKELTNPVRVIGDDAGCVAGVELEIMELGEPDASGRRRPVPTGKHERLDVQLFVVAIGNGPNPMLTKAWNSSDEKIPKLAVSDKGLIVADRKTQETNVKGVFAGGDIVTGAATVIEAMGAGKRAAASIISYLKKL